MKIETERLFLREMTESDYDALYAVLADSDIMQHYPYTFDEKRVRGWIEKNIERYRVHGFGLWAVCLKKTGEMIGDCGLTMQNINGVTRPEIGYHIRKDMQRNGYAREAASAVRDWTFENTSFSEIYSYMKSSNIPSAKCALSWGCRETEEYTDAENETTKVFCITKSEWRNIRNKGCSRVVDGEIRLVPYYPAPDVTLVWYQDAELCRQIDSEARTYSPELLENMYDFLCSNGDCFYIEYRGELAGDITLLGSGEICITVCTEYQNRHIGRRSVAGILKLAAEKDFGSVKANIYSFNVQSRKMFLACGFKQIEDEWFEYLIGTGDETA